MNHHITRAIVLSGALLSLIVVTPAAVAQSNVTAANKFSWSENCGWMNWRDAGSPAASQGVIAAGSFLSGFIWGENIGWINLGDGSPGNLLSYANASGDDAGVNRDPGTGALSGLAWGENVGWINFTLPALPAEQQPRLDTAGGNGGSRLRGYAWGENIGWINLDSGDEGKHVGIRTCVADFNEDGNLDPDDLGDYINCFFDAPPCARADFNADGNVDPDDLGDFINAFFAGCP